MFRTVGNTDPGIQKAQIIVYLRNRPHSGTGIVGCGFLINGNGRGQTVYLIHIGFFRIAQKLPGIG